LLFHWGLSGAKLAGDDYERFVIELRGNAMRITNDDYTPIELLSELTSRSTSHCAEPESFFKGEKKKHTGRQEAIDQPPRLVVGDYLG